MAQTRLTGSENLSTLTDFGDLYSQTLFITVTSQRAKQAAKRFIVNTIISDQECSMLPPTILELSTFENE
ncbi:hypothetical protein HGT73_14295 [Rosenbergiella australiborealis]|uniref:Uncharacterized protein n=1 Tax=Rosenbergiella australiborealis TaxID=1544696 RepID=A0ABS5T817_9GAMM|nr:hypothetical protein [Rosenbergiella australiborealis]MBT0728513.1 hypothetical protein [Rosenbergiella australiborealis]